MAQYTLFAKSGCSRCTNARKALERMGADFDVVDLATDAGLRQAHSLNLTVAGTIIENATGEKLSVQNVRNRQAHMLTAPPETAVLDAPAAPAAISGAEDTLALEGGEFNPEPAQTLDEFVSSYEEPNDGTEEIVEVDQIDPDTGMIVGHSQAHMTSGK